MGPSQICFPRAYVLENTRDQVDAMSDKRQERQPPRELRKLLRQWFDTLVERAPADDPRHTEDCLPIPAVFAVAAGQETDDRSCRHAASCDWCRRAVDIAQRLLREEPSLSVRDSAPDARWPEALREQLAGTMPAASAAPPQPPEPEEA